MRILDPHLLEKLKENIYTSLEQLNEAAQRITATINNWKFQKKPGARNEWFEKYDKPNMKPLPGGKYATCDYKLETGEVSSAGLHPGEAIFIPSGYAHGFLTLEANTLFQWCVDNGFCADAARVVNYKSCNIKWPVDVEKFVVGERDREAPVFSTHL